MPLKIVPLTRDTLVGWESKFFSRVEPIMDDRGCWEWSGARSVSGYGQMYASGKMWMAHRISIVLAGYEPGILYVCHHCDNPSCVNPSHLFLGTCLDNTIDRVSKGRGLMPFADDVPCPRGHTGRFLTRNRTNGKPWRRCRICHAEKCKEWRRVKHEAA